MGTANQFRSMGAAFGLAITTSVFNGYINHEIKDLGIAYNGSSFSPDQLASLPANLQHDIKFILSEGYNRQMLVLTAFSAVQIPAAMLLWRRPHIEVE